MAPPTQARRPSTPAGIDKLTVDSPSPLRADKDGKYAVPRPGQETRREY